MGKEYTRSVSSIWNPLPISERTLNVGYKEIEVPADTFWQLLYGQIQMVTTATVGDRHLMLAFRNPSAFTVFSVKGLTVQSASKNWNYPVMPQGILPNDYIADHHVLPIPAYALLGAGWTIAIVETQGVDEDADDIFVELVVNQVSV